jgi:uncharacterized protein with HEPN domain
MSRSVIVQHNNIPTRKAVLELVVNLLPPIRLSRRLHTNLISAISVGAFVNDEKKVDAVVCNLTIIGEVAQHIPADIRARISVIPWTYMRGMRHRIVHDYLAVDTAIVRQTVTEDLPPLIHHLQSLIST